MIEQRQGHRVAVVLAPAPTRPLRRRRLLHDFAGSHRWQQRREAQDAELVLEAAVALGRRLVVVSTVDPPETHWWWG